MPSRSGALLSRLVLLQRELDALNADLNRLVTALDEVLAVLSITRRVADLLSRLYQLLEALYYGLGALVGVPIVGQVAKAVQEVIGVIKNAVQPFKEQVERMEDQLRPLREQVEPVRDRMAAYRAPVRELQAFVTRERTQLAAANDSVEALTPSRYERSQAADLDRVADGLGGVVERCLARASASRRELGQVFGSLARVESACGGLAETTQMLDDLIGRVDNVQNDAKAVEDTLNLPIGYAGEETTIADVLRMISIIPEEVMEEIASALRGPLGALESGTSLKLPDLGALVAAFEAALNGLRAAKSKMDGALPELDGLTRDDDVPGAFAAVAS